MHFIYYTMYATLAQCAACSLCGFGLIVYYTIYTTYDIANTVTCATVFFVVIHIKGLCSQHDKKDTDLQYISRERARESVHAQFDIFCRKRDLA